MSKTQDTINGYYHQISKEYTIYIPAKYSPYTRENRFKAFYGRKLGQQDKLFRFIKSGGIAILSGDWETIIKVYDYFCRKKKEFLGGINASSKKNSRAILFRPILNRIALKATRATINVDPSQTIPYLFNFTGEIEDGMKEKAFFIPFHDYLKIKKSLDRRTQVKALNISLYTHYNVLIPASQGLYQLVKDALVSLKPSLPDSITALDMGCGSGVLTILTAQIMGNTLTQIYATDILPEALGTCKMNIDYCSHKRVIDPQKITITNGGDLFATTLPREKFNVILFNAPWAVPYQQVKENNAVSDYGYDILKRFLSQSLQYLKSNGHIILCYSDHSGHQIIKNLEKLIHEYGYLIKDRSSEKIRAQGRQKKWERAYVYNLIGKPA